MAPTYLSPGVYVEEVDGGSKPIEGVPTAVAAFVGFAEKGPIQTPTLVTNWTELVDGRGGVVEGVVLRTRWVGYFTSRGAGGRRSLAKFSLTGPIRSREGSAPATQPSWAVMETWAVKDTRWVNFPPGAAHMSSTRPRNRGAVQAMSSWEDASWT